MTTRIQAIHYDTRQFRDILITGGRVQNMWIQTDKGILPLQEVFPIAARNEIVAHFNRITTARSELIRIEGEVYKLLNDSGTWRGSL